MLDALKRTRIDPNGRIHCLRFVSMAREKTQAQDQTQRVRIGQVSSLQMNEPAFCVLSRWHETKHKHRALIYLAGTKQNASTGSNSTRTHCENFVTSRNDQNDRTPCIAFCLTGTKQNTSTRRCYVSLARSKMQARDQTQRARTGQISSLQETIQTTEPPAHCVLTRLHETKHKHRKMLCPAGTKKNASTGSNAARTHCENFVTSGNDPN